ncbi:MAG: methyltransferase type 11, partial [Deltaproteobacteria bacterium]|nr:methyltransferase type 11 [Deltaproteobacteria bacterium]
MEEPTIELSELPRLWSDAFTREDDGNDREFYRDGRSSPPLDSVALGTVEGLIGSLCAGDEPEILDLMAGSDSHLPASLRPGRLVGLGLDGRAMEANGALDQSILHDLNEDPNLPFADA